MKETWDHRISRAETLAAEFSESQEFLTFYTRLLRCQKDIYEQLRSRKGWLPTGNLEGDLPAIRGLTKRLLRTVEKHGSKDLADNSRSLMDATDSERDTILLEYWHAPNDTQFFAKAFLQPYAQWLRETGAGPVDRGLEGGENRCPFCRGTPQLSVIRIREAASESGSRELVCATCLNPWGFKRVVCASCCEQDPAKVGYYQAEGLDHIRVEACDKCKRYIKAVDLTRYGHAVPLVDEVAAAPLDLWARDHGYTKIEMNLVGL